MIKCAVTEIAMYIHYTQVTWTSCTTNLTQRRRFLLQILQMIQTQTTAVSLLQVTLVGDSHSARMNIVLSANHVSMALH